MMKVLNQHSYFIRTHSCISELGHTAKEFKTSQAVRFKAIKHTANFLKTTVKLITKTIKLIIVSLYEALTLPIHGISLKRRISKQIKNDIAAIPAEKIKSLNKYTDNLIQCENIDSKKIKMKEANPYINSTYSSTKKGYAPVVFAWAVVLMEKAVAEGRNLVFLARDGRAPYEVAKIIQKSNPKYKDIKMSYLYLSRKVVADAAKKPGLLTDYAQQEGVRKNDKCLFVDIGFMGSMIDPIKEQMKKLNLDIKFEYLISHTNKANGFIGDLMKTGKLESIKIAGAGGNPAVHWLEDTHQGVINSPKFLVKDKETNQIYPNVAPPKGKGEVSTCKNDRPIDFICKSVAMKAITDFAKEKLKKRKRDFNAYKVTNLEERVKFSPYLDPSYSSIETKKARKRTSQALAESLDLATGSKKKMTFESVLGKASDKMRDKFDKFLSSIISGKRLLYIKHV